MYQIQINAKRQYNVMQLASAEVPTPEDNGNFVAESLQVAADYQQVMRRLGGRPRDVTHLLTVHGYNLLMDGYGYVLFETPRHTASGSAYPYEARRWVFVRPNQLRRIR